MQFEALFELRGVFCVPLAIFVIQKGSEGPKNYFLCVCWDDKFQIFSEK